LERRETHLFANVFVVGNSSAKSLCSLVANQTFAKVENYIFVEIIKSGFTLSFKNSTEALQYSSILLFFLFSAELGIFLLKPTYEPVNQQLFFLILF